MSDIGSLLNEFGGVQKQIDSLNKWIKDVESNIDEQLHKKSRFRQELLQADIKKLSDIQQSIFEKNSSLFDICPDNEEIKSKIDKLDKKVNALLEKRLLQQTSIEDYRMFYQDCQQWIEKITKSLTVLDEAKSLNSNEKLSKLQQIIEDFDRDNKAKLEEMNNKSALVIPEVDSMDQQQIKEQKISFERRLNDLKKRIERKRQIIELAQTGYTQTKSEIEEIKDWVKSKNELLQTMKSQQITKETVKECKTLTKEVDSKILVIESIESKIEMISGDIETSEHAELKKNLIAAFEEHKLLQKSSKEAMKYIEEAVTSLGKYEGSCEDIKNWLKAKKSDINKCIEYDPLKSTNIEKKISLLKKELNEICEYEESHVSQFKLLTIGLQKKSLKENIENHSSELVEDLDMLKNMIKEKITTLEDNLDERKDFESDLEKCNLWLDHADTILTTEIRGTINIAILDDHHNKFKRLKRAEEENREKVTDVFETASKFMETLSDADRIALQTILDDVCDRQNQIADTINAKISNLVRNIDIYRTTAQKIEDSVNHLTEIQTQIRLLNKPIGYRVEDAEDVLEAYGKILENLKAFKIQMEDLQKTAGTNVNEIRTLLGQQEELISAIENQMIKIRNLISVRHQFMTMVTGITSFIIKHTEVVKQVERSNIPLMEKVSNYDESILKLKDCETQLALASDKGQQIANEGSAADRNQISHQLQSLKTQILALKKAIEKKRAEHIKSVKEHNKLYADLESHLEWIQEKEVEVRERPLLKTTVADVEDQISLHKQLTHDIMEHIEKVRDINEVAKEEREIPPMVFEMLSTASALVQAMPKELEERKQYLENNKNYRLQYDSLVERLNNWIEEAQIKLRPIDSGIDYENLHGDLQDHAKYFSQELKLKELLHSIHDMANKIWASLATQDQDKINHEQEFLTQLVKNTLNSATNTQKQFEENIKLWNNHMENMNTLHSLLENDIKFEPENPASFAGLKTSIQKIDTQIKMTESKKCLFDQFSTEAKKLEQSADSINKHKISEKSNDLQHQWKTILDSLKEQKENLATLALQWEDFDVKSKSFKSQLSSYLQQFDNIDTTFRSITQMKETKKLMINLMDSVKNIEGRYKDVQILSGYVLRYKKEIFKCKI